jgi:hypothetical protein
MEENQSYSTVVDRNSEWPNLNALIARGALPTNYLRQHASLDPAASKAIFEMGAALPV